MTVLEARYGNSQIYSASPIVSKIGFSRLWWLWNNGTYAGLGIFGQLIYINPAAGRFWFRHRLIASSLPIQSFSSSSSP